MADVERDDLVLSDVRLARQGDGPAYARIICRYQQPLARRMMRFARGQADVEELVHEVFVEAYFSLPKFRADAPFEHWLQRIATRVGYHYWKRLQKRRKIDAHPLDWAEHVAAAQSSSDLAPADAAEILAVLMDKLPPRDRLVITLLHIEGRTVDETATLTGWSRTMVKVQAYRARDKLRRLLESAEAASNRGHAP